MSGRSGTRKLTTKDKKPTRVRVPIVFDQQVADVYFQAAVDTQTAKQLEDDAIISKAEAAEEKARQALEEVTVEYYFESIGRDAFNNLIDAHPPSDEQVMEAEKEGVPRPLFNGDEFWKHALVACCAQPELTEEDVNEMWESPSWNDDEITSLCQAAWSANKQRSLLDVGKGSPRTANSNGNSATASRRGSRTRRSSASADAS